MLVRYKREWKDRFLKDPKPDDPLLISVRRGIPFKLGQRGVKSRVNKIVSKIGLRDVSKI